MTLFRIPIVRAVLLAAVLPIIGMIAIAGSCEAVEAHAAGPHAIHPIVATEAPAAEICFPSSIWNPTGPGVSAEDRPCDMLERPQEDGSTYLILGTLGSDAADCYVPNPYEERGTFYIVCHRVPNR